MRFSGGAWFWMQRLIMDHSVFRFFCLIHCGRHKMASMLKATVSVSCMKIVILLFKFRWNVCPNVESIFSQHWFHNGLTPNRRQTIIWTNSGLIYWHKHASLGLDDLTFKDGSLNWYYHASMAVKLQKVAPRWLVIYCYSASIPIDVQFSFHMFDPQHANTST